MIACITDHDQVVAASGQGSRELMGKAISKELDRVITEREMKCYHTGERKNTAACGKSERILIRADRTANHLFR